MKRSMGLKIMVQLISLVRPLMGAMTLAIIMGTVGSLCAMFVPIGGVFMALRGEGISFWIFVLVLMAVALLRGIFHYIEQLCNHYIAFKLLALLRHRLFQALRRLSPAKLETQEKGNLMALMSGDIELLEVFYAHTISPVMIGFFSSIIMTLFIGSFHFSLAIVAALGYLSLGLLLPYFSSHWGKEAGMDYRHQWGEMNNSFLDSLQGLKEVRQFHWGERRLDFLRDLSQKCGISQRKIKAHEGTVTGGSGALLLFFTSLALFLSLWLVHRGVLTWQEGVISVVALASSFGPVLALSLLSNHLLQTLAAGERVLNLLKEEPLVKEVTDGVETSFEGASCQNLSFGYEGGQEVLSHLNMEFPQGKIIGIQGKSGCGKSTLLRLLMRFWEAQRGEVKISQRNINEINSHHLRELESFVTQETALFKDTIENNIKLGRPEATLEEVMEAAAKASLHDFIETLPNGYQSEVGIGGQSLSGGERQRLGVARTFLRKAPFILLDEPTANLDSLNEAILLNSLKEYQEDKTIVLVSHRASTLGIAHKIYKL